MVVSRSLLIVCLSNPVTIDSLSMHKQCQRRAVVSCWFLLAVDGFEIFRAVNNILARQLMC